MKRISISLIFCILFINGFAQTNTEVRTKNVKKLLELSGSGKNGMQVAQTMITTFKKSLPDIPEEYWDSLIKEINVDELIELVIPIYIKYYSDEEIEKLIEFYQTPLGKKLILTTPKVMQESMQAGQVWGKGIGEKVYNNLYEKGFIKK